MNFVNRYFNVTNKNQETKILGEVKAVQNTLSKYAFTKDQHLGFEAAA
jgi:hypothetical protein